MTERKDPPGDKSAGQPPEAASETPSQRPAPSSGPIEIRTVMVDDPRRMPTLRLPRERKEIARTEGKGRTGKAVQTDQARPPPRIAATPPVQVKPATLPTWVYGAIIAVALVVLVVALAVR